MTVAVRAGELADAELARPVAQAERRLGVAGLGDVAEEQEVRRRQGDHERRRSGARGAGCADCRHDASRRSGRPSEPHADREADTCAAGSRRGPRRRSGSATRRLEGGDAVLVAEVLAVELERPVVAVEPVRAGRWSCSCRAHAAGMWRRRDRRGRRSSRSARPCRRPGRRRRPSTSPNTLHS